MKKVLYLVVLPVLVTASFATGSCTVSPPEGQMECSSTEDCPENWYCHIEEDGLCYSTPPGEEPDAAEPDAS